MLTQSKWDEQATDYMTRVIVYCPKQPDISHLRHIHHSPLPRDYWGRNPPHFISTRKRC